MNTFELLVGSFLGVFALLCVARGIASAFVNRGWFITLIGGEDE